MRGSSVLCIAAWIVGCQPSVRSPGEATDGFQTTGEDGLESSSETSAGDTNGDRGSTGGTTDDGDRTSTATGPDSEPEEDTEGTGGDDTTKVCGTRQCVDTTAQAAVLLEPCADYFAEFSPPFDGSYECWSGAPGGLLVGDTDVTFANDDPDVLLVGRWDGGIAQARVTRDARCNITGFVDATWQSYPESEPGDVFVRGMTWLEDGTMVLARSVSGHPQQLGQRAPGTAVTGHLVDTLSLLPPWEQHHIGQGEVAVSLTVVPHGFPGAGQLKMLAEQSDSSHWFTVPMTADGGGTYDFEAAIEETTIYPPEPEWGGYYARGMAWIGDENPKIDTPSVLIPEAWHYTVSLYELDDAGNPRPDTRQPFVEGLGMPSGAEADAVSGNNFVFTGRRSQDVYVVRGCHDAPATEPPQ
jgi:hypothetical protein